MPDLSGQLRTGNNQAGFAVIWGQEIPPIWLLNWEMKSGDPQEMEAKRSKLGFGNISYRPLRGSLLSLLSL